MKYICNSDANNELKKIVCRNNIKVQNNKIVPYC